MHEPSVVKYKVTDAFGFLAKWTVINALLLARSVDDFGHGLLYHPKTRGECPSFELCVLAYGGLWTKSDRKDQYINVADQAINCIVKLNKYALKKWKRKIYFQPKTQKDKRTPRC